MFKLYVKYNSETYNNGFVLMVTLIPWKWYEEFLVKVSTNKYVIRGQNSRLRTEIILTKTLQNEKSF